jgi:hypothetical protein
MDIQRDNERRGTRMQEEGGETSVHSEITHHRSVTKCPFEGSLLVGLGVVGSDGGSHRVAMPFLKEAGLDLLRAAMSPIVRNVRTRPQTGQISHIKETLLLIEKQPQSGGNRPPSGRRVHEKLAVSWRGQQSSC